MIYFFPKITQNLTLTQVMTIQLFQKIKKMLFLYNALKIKHNATT